MELHKELSDNKLVVSSKHWGRFYDSTDALIVSIEGFVRQGWVRGQKSIIICRASTWSQLVDRFKLAPGYSDKVIFFDAHKVLESVLLPNGHVERNIFISRLKELTQAFANESGLRFYGEIVDILCEAGNHKLSITLESYWNEFLAEHEGCFLLCGYNKKFLTTVQETFEVGCTHSECFEVSEAVLEPRIDDLLYQMSVLEMSMAEKNGDMETLKKELAVFKSHILHLGRLSLLGEFAAGLAHEINNPLTIAKGQIGIIQRNLDSLSRPAVQDKLKKTDLALDRMAKLLQNVLRFSRPESVDKEPIFIGSLVQNCIEFIIESFKEVSINVQFNNSANDVLVMGDETTLCQVLLNVMSNARDAISLNKVPRGLIEVVVNPLDKNWVKIIIKDNGIGIDGSL